MAIKPKRQEPQKGETVMADQANGNTAEIELKEGARIEITVSVREDTKEGRLLKDGPRVVVIDGKRIARRTMYYPFPQGFAEDPLSGKPADVTMNHATMTKAITEWLNVLTHLEKVAVDSPAYASEPNEADRKVFRFSIINNNPANDIDPATGKPKVIVGHGSSPMKYLPSLFGESGVFGKGFKLAIQGPANLDLAREYVIAGPKVTVAKTARTRAANVANFE